METTLITTNNDTSIADEVPSLLVPMVGKPLLLPTVSVAEMLPYKQPVLSEKASEKVAELSDSQSWYLGDVLWRGVMVPMISYEAINGGDIAPVKGISQMAVLNNTSNHPKLPFIALPTQGIPRLSRVVDANIKHDQEATALPYDKMHVKVVDEEAIIPNVAALEQAYIQLMQL